MLNNEIIACLFALSLLHLMKQRVKYLFLSVVCSIGLLSVQAQESQNKELLKVNSGNLTVYKVVESGSSFKFESASKPWPVSFAKEGEEFKEVIINRAGIIEEKYEADLPGFPAYFKSSSSEIVVSAIDGKLYYYSWSIKTGASIKYVFSESKIKNYNDEKATIDNYRNTLKELQTTARTQRIEQNNALAEKLAEENTLKGKLIKAIRIIPVNKPSDLGLLSIVSIGVEFELDNGKVLKTKNLGGFTPYTDFEAEVSGGEFAGGDFKVADDTRKIPNDKIEITVWSKFDEKKLKGKYHCDINYKKDISYYYGGSSGANGRAYTSGYTINGSSGSDGKSVNILVTTFVLNGEKINKLVITDAFSGKTFAEAKLHMNNTISINTSGGNGGNGSEEKTGNGGDGGNGGNGGNIRLSGNGATDLKIVSSSTGGKGGLGGRPKTSAYFNGKSGKSGADGILTR